MIISRDFEANPYTPHEERVAKYINDIAGIGGGDDPIEFLIASHHALRREVSRLKAELKDIEEELWDD